MTDSDSNMLFFVKLHVAFLKQVLYQVYIAQAKMFWGNHQLIVSYEIIWSYKMPLACTSFGHKIVILNNVSKHKPSDKKSMQITSLLFDSTLQHVHVIYVRSAFYQAIISQSSHITI